MPKWFQHKKETHRETLLKFFGLLGVLAAYFVYLSIEYDILTGGYLSALTWSFFVLCTPIADAGFLLDFPIRLLFRVRMIYSEIAVWIIAIAVNLVGISAFPELYQKTFLTTVFLKILTTPWPYWGIILLSGAGTFLSIFFGDEMLDVLKHRNRKKYHRHNFKWQILAFVSLLLLAIVGYLELIKSLGIDLDQVF